MIAIPLTLGKQALVDACDYHRLSQFTWHAHKEGRTYYAIREIRKAGQKRQVIRMHNEVLRVPQGLRVDHRNGDGLLNTRSNLRPATHQQNTFNARKRIGTTSRFKGVSWDSVREMWYAYVGGGKIKRQFLGRFSKERAAAVAYDAAASNTFGEFAKLNFPS